jgi:hypothetical protein
MRSAVPVVVVVLAALTFFNPWTLAFIAGGALVGWVFGEFFRNWRRGLTALAIVGVCGVVALVGFLVIGFSHGLGGARTAIRIGVEYRATAVYEPHKFLFKEQFALTAKAVKEMRAAMGGSKWPGVASLVRPLGWHVVQSDGRMILERTRRPAHRSIRFWPPRTELQLHTPTIRFAADALLEPDEASAILIKADHGVVRSTDPDGKVSSDGTERTISLNNSGSFFPLSDVKIEVNSNAMAGSVI